MASEGADGGLADIELQTLQRSRSEGLTGGRKVRGRHKRDGGNKASRGAAAAAPAAPAQHRPPFAFDIEFAASDSPSVVGSTALLRARLRHAHSAPITLAPGVAGAFSVGVRIYQDGGAAASVFEDRMVAHDGAIAPGEWSNLSVRIPIRAFGDTGTARVTIDMLKEGEFWFSPPDGPAVDTIVSLRSDAGGRSPEPAEPKRTAADAQEREAVTRQLVFDLSDLVHYFHEARLPTGIQRVQIEIVDSLLDNPPADCTLSIACFTQQQDSWVELPTAFFRSLCGLALRGGDREEPAWTHALYKLGAHLSQRPTLEFRKGAFLVNLGTSWWLRNYFLNVRAAKAKYGIRYVPFVHDCIPVITPEHCIEALTRDFINWLLSAFQHADHIMVNSNATAADVVKVARYLGHEIDPPAVVTLDADYRVAAAGRDARAAAVEDSGLFARHGIEPGKYVLFVSTIESRKNHLLAFSAWLTLLKKHGQERVPKLVCVGSRGWLNDAIYAKLAASKLLQRNVVMLSRIADPDLKQLYGNCLFTLYPSSYEGWGLPVTESLCYGKVPALANSSSLPEAGGPFGEYFDPGSEKELVEVLERLMFDERYRRSREKEIAARFRPRSWAAIGEQMLGLMQVWSTKKAPGRAGAVAVRGLWAFPAKLGRYYGLTEILDTEITPTLEPGEIYRQGDAWWWPEPWGCWTKPGLAKLAFAAPSDDALIVYVAVRGVQGRPSRVAIEASGGDSRTLPLGSEEDRWLTLRIEPAAGRTQVRSAKARVIEIGFSADAAVDFSERTGGKDHRIASMGVRGFMVCEEADTAGRLQALESIMSGHPEMLLAAR
ncbi:MAG TPA: glycosyltransferase family 1 protein [Acidisphaera sp.]|nr:glycosyltransferase family 1 protein [Acidisphaera sp.]